MYPPLGLGQIRISENDVTIGKKLRIPKGTLVWVPHHGIMNTQLNWEEPTRFNPGTSILGVSENFSPLRPAQELYKIYLTAVASCSIGKTSGKAFCILGQSCLCLPHMWPLESWVNRLSQAANACRTLLTTWRGDCKQAVSGCLLVRRHRPRRLWLSP